MAKKTNKGLSGFIAWAIGTIVVLAVAFGLISGTLAIPLIPMIVTKITGYSVVGLVIVGAVMKILKK